MTSNTILISGAGQLGSRYLQGLARGAMPLHIHVQDPSPASLKQAEDRWNGVAATANGLHTVSFHSALTDVPKHIDVAIVATTAHIRPLVIEQIAAHAQVRFWIVEKVLAQSEGALDAILEHIGPKGKAWVNKPRRMLEWHQAIKSHLPQGQTMTLKVDGGAWGLACNSVHFLDMFSWFTGEALQDVDTSQLQIQWQEAKRAGNWEVMGTISAKFSGGSVARFTANEGEVFYRFEIQAGEHVWHIDEDNGIAKRSDGLDLPGRLPYQSEVSATLVETILMNGNCELPTLKTSVDLHRVFIRRLLEHWQRNVDQKAVALPIT